MNGYVATGQRYYDYLTAAQSSLVRQLPWQADTLRVNNPSDQSVYIRLGGQDQPGPTSYDDFVPPFSERSISVHSALFALALAGVPAAFAPGIASAAGRVTIVYSRGDQPGYASSYQQLGLAASSDILISGGAVGQLPVTGSLDLSGWGGLLFSGSPIGTDWHQQGYATYQNSDDNATWFNVARLPLWPGMVTNAQLPRVGRYARMLYQPYGPPWAVSPTFTLRVRPTITEILQVTPTLAGMAPVLAWGPLGAGQTALIYLPGDLVAAIDWGADLDAAGAGQVLINAIGYLDAGLLKPSQTTILGPFGLTGASAVHGTIAEMYPITQFRIVRTAGSATGSMYFVPLVRTGPPDVVGNPGDSTAALTMAGMTRNMRDALGTIAAQTLLRGGALSQAPSYAHPGGGVWVYTGNNFLGTKILGMSLFSPLAGTFGVGYGDGSTLHAPLWFGALAANTNSPWQQAGQDVAIDVTGFIGIWLFSLVAVTLTLNVWSA